MSGDPSGCPSKWVPVAALLLGVTEPRCSAAGAPAPSGVPPSVPRTEGEHPCGYRGRPAFPLSCRKGRLKPHSGSVSWEGTCCPTQDVSSRDAALLRVPWGCFNGPHSLAVGGRGGERSPQPLCEATAGSGSYLCPLEGSRAPVPDPTEVTRSGSFRTGHRGHREAASPAATCRRAWCATPGAATRPPRKPGLPTSSGRPGASGGRVPLAVSRWLRRGSSLPYRHACLYLLGRPGRVRVAPVGGKLVFSCVLTCL